MRPTAILLCALAFCSFAAAAHAQTPAKQDPTKEDIVCAFSANCGKAHTRAFQRGITVTGAPAEQPPGSINLYVNFAYNSADLTADARITLDRLGQALKDQRLSGFSFMIAGHTDAKGGADFNQKLSERRAETVRQYLIAQYGVDANLLTAKGFGKQQLLDPQHPEDGVNRRVQVVDTTSGHGH